MPPNPTTPQMRALPPGLTKLAKGSALDIPTRSESVSCHLLKQAAPLTAPKTAAAPKKIVFPASKSPKPVSTRQGLDITTLLNF